MADGYYSDRTAGPTPRVHDALPAKTSAALLAVVEDFVRRDYLAQSFPEQCHDSSVAAGTNQTAFRTRVDATIPDLEPPDPWSPVPDAAVLDYLEFVGRRIAKPELGDYHRFFGHHHLRGFDASAGQAEFRAEVNELLARGGTRYEMSADARVEHLGTPEVDAVLRRLRPSTGDDALDRTIERARNGYKSKIQHERVNALKDLWDAFERIKTLDATDKKRSVQMLLSNFADVAIRDVIEADMTALTAVGNQFSIRHFETDQHPLPAEQLDYVAGRIANLLLALLEASGRLAP